MNIKKFILAACAVFVTGAVVSGDAVAQQPYNGFCGTGYSYGNRCQSFGIDYRYPRNYNDCHGSGFLSGYGRSPYQCGYSNMRLSPSSGYGSYRRYPNNSYRGYNSPVGYDRGFYTNHRPHTPGIGNREPDFGGRGY